MVAKCWFNDFLVSNPENIFINFYTHSALLEGITPLCTVSPSESFRWLFTLNVVYKFVFFYSRHMNAFILVKDRSAAQLALKISLTEVITTVTGNYVQWGGKNFQSKRKSPWKIIYTKISPNIKTNRQRKFCAMGRKKFTI